MGDKREVKDDGGDSYVVDESWNPTKPYEFRKITDPPRELSEQELRWIEQFAPKDSAGHDYLDQARRAVVERGAAYGTPKDNHDATAAFWQAYFDRRFRGGPVRVDAEDVCVLMILQKICREANERKPDNMVDVCGYAQNIGMIRQANEAKEER